MSVCLLCIYISVTKVIITRGRVLPPCEICHAVYAFMLFLTLKLNLLYTGLLFAYLLTYWLTHCEVVRLSATPLYTAVSDSLAWELTQNASLLVFGAICHRERSAATETASQGHQKSLDTTWFDVVLYRCQYQDASYNQLHGSHQQRRYWNPGRPRMEHHSSHWWQPRESG